MTTVIESLEQVLQQNKNIPSALLGKRVFERTQDAGAKELLTLVYTDVREPIVWGHVFKKEEVWVSLFVGFKTWFNARDDEQVFVRFWHHLSYFGDWYPLDSLGGQGIESYRESKSYGEAVKSLREMLEDFDIEKIASEDLEEFQTDYRILGVYPFPVKIDILPSYPT